jgi:hypothetical protein
VNGQNLKILKCVLAPGRNFPLLCFEWVTSLSIFCVEPGRNAIVHNEPFAKIVLGELGKSAAEPTSLGAGRVLERRLARVKQRERSELTPPEYLGCSPPR